MVDHNEDYIETLLSILPYRDTLEDALAEVGVSRQAVHWRKVRDPDLAARYKMAMDTMKKNRRQKQARTRMQVRSEMALAKKRKIALELDRMQWALNECEGNVIETCKLLDMSVSTFYRRVNSSPEFLRKLNAYRVHNNIEGFPQNVGGGRPPG